MYHLIRIAGIVIALTLLLAVFVRPAQAGDTIHAPADNGEQAEDTGLVCLALVGGTAILAAGMWMSKLRRTLS
jgi:hypothetical protein